MGIVSFEINHRNGLIYILTLIQKLQITKMLFNSKD